MTRQAAESLGYVFKRDGRGDWHALRGAQAYGPGMKLTGLLQVLAAVEYYKAKEKDVPR